MPIMIRKKPIKISSFAMCCGDRVNEFVNRYELLNNQFDNDLKLTLFCDGDTIVDKRECIEFIFEGNQNRIGLGANFARLLKYAAGKQFDYLMYTEDDVLFHPLFRKKLELALSMTCNPKLISMYTCELHPSVPFNDNANPVPSGWVEWNAAEKQIGTQCFIIDREFFEHFSIEAINTFNLNPFRFILDQYLFGFAKKYSYTTVFHVPSLVAHLNWRTAGNTKIHNGYGVETWASMYAT
jgi:hypothetical protein